MFLEAAYTSAFDSSQLISRLGSFTSLNVFVKDSARQGAAVDLNIHLTAGVTGTGLNLASRFTLGAHHYSGREAFTCDGVCFLSSMTKVAGWRRAPLNCHQLVAASHIRSSHTDWLVSDV